MKPQWHENLLLVCEKCGKKMTQAPTDLNPALELKNWLKKEFIKRDLWGVNRVVTSSCLDVCPEGKVAIAFVSDRPDLGFEVESINPVEDRGRILEKAIFRAKPAAR